MDIGLVFDAIIVKPFATILVGAYQALNFLHVPYPLGFSIVALTIIIRFLIYPLISSQLKSSKKMQTIAPHLRKLKEKHKGDTKSMQAETMRLYREHGINPAAGCLPILIQMPIIYGLYSLLQKIVSLDATKIVSEVNKLIYIDAFKLTSPWDISFFGLPLGKGPSDLLGTIGPLVFIVPLATGFFQFVMSKMLIKPAPAAGTNVSFKKDDKKASGGKEDFATAFQTQSLYIFPIMIGFFSYTFPIGLSLYWNTFTIFGIIQQYKVLGLGGLASWTIKKKKL